jgi:hypothetical protein
MCAVRGIIGMWQASFGSLGACPCLEEAEQQLQKMGVRSDTKGMRVWQHMVGGVGVKHAAECSEHALLKLQQKLQLWWLQQCCKSLCQYNRRSEEFCMFTHSFAPALLHSVLQPIWRFAYGCSLCCASGYGPRWPLATLNCFLHGRFPVRVA